MSQERRSRSGGRRAGGDSRYGAGQRTAARLTLLFFVAGLASPLQAVADETALGPAHTIAGDGEFTALGSPDYSPESPTLTEYTQYSDRAIVQWQGIHQGAGHTLSFRQGEGAAVLNTSLGASATEFAGSLRCDATCIFANPLGIHFQDGSFVDVGQLIAAAGDISSQAFMGGDLHFENPTGEVTNRGTLRGRSIGLFGARVANFGEISVPDGALWMLAGEEVLMRDLDSPVLIRSALPSGGGQQTGEPFSGAPAVENAGTIDAGRGRVRLAAGDMLAFAIRQSGRIRAADISLEGGDGGGVEVSGELDASAAEAGAGGGRIEVLGDYVALEADARLDASGSAGGGRIWVGGDEQGRGERRASRATYVHPDAQIRADALDDGDGGRIVVWSDGDSHVYGALSARGGERGGSGGFVETSGKRYLDVDRSPDLRARGGRPGDRGGEWLIDPNNIEIVAACPEGPACLDPALDPDRRSNPLFQEIKPSVNDSEISADVISGALEDGFAVTISTRTVGDAPGPQNGDITVSSAIEVREDDIARPGARARLWLLAANDITVDEDIGVVRSEGSNPTKPSGILLDVVLQARDTGQPQNQPASSDDPGNSFVGDVTINAAIETGGGDVLASGAGVTLGQSGVIATDGGKVAVIVSGGDFEVISGGGIDTTTDVPPAQDQDLEPTGGRIAVLAQAFRRAENSQIGSQTDVFGGDIRVDGQLRSGGGRLALSASGGDILVPGEIDSGGGKIDLRADSVTFSAPGESDLTQGGTITVGAGGKILSGGGGVEIGRGGIVLVANSAVLLESAKQIHLLGQIDTRQYDATGSPDGAKTGGSVSLKTLDENSEVVIRREPGSANPAITTNGGRFTSSGPGSFHLEGVIDVAPGTPMSSDDVDSNIVIQHGGDVTLGRPGGARTHLDASEQVFVGAGLDGSGTLRFEGDAGQIEVTGDEIILAAGDGYTVPSGDPVDTAHIELGNTRFSNYASTGSGGNPPDVPDTGVAPSVNPSRFSLLQDASLGASDIPALTHFVEGDVADLDYTLAASDGEITIGDASRVQGSELTLQAARGVSLPSFGQGSLGSLDIQIAEDFTVSSTLAGNVTGASDELHITAGALGNTASGNLTLRDDLTASTQLELHAGAGGSGDLQIDGGVRLYSDDITLWAGAGDGSATTARVLADEAVFRDGSGDGTTAPRAFTLRQDAAIDGDTIPARVQFGADPTSPIEYTLRSDTSGITIDDRAAAALYDTELALHASTTIVLQSPLGIRTLDIGGLRGFVFGQAMNDRIDFTNDAESRLVVRAGLASAGNLAFEGGLTIAADEIRLVAGDGVGGSLGDGDEGASSILLTPADGGATPVFQGRSTATLRSFVFRQDGDIGLGDLPSKPANFAENSPGRYFIRSDDGGLSLGPDDLEDGDAAGFASDRLPQASERLVLWAETVDLVRGDGEDLDITTDFGLSDSNAMEIRTSSVVLESTTGEDSASPPKVVPGAYLTLTDFADDPAGGAAASPTPDPLLLDLDAPGPVQAPDEILLVQDASIESDDLIDLGQLGSTGSGKLGTYWLTSERGGIAVTNAKVTGSDLLLTLAGTDPDDTRDIVFESPSYDLASLDALEPGSWSVQGPNDSALTIIAEESIRLEAGAGGSGNLGFGTNVRLESNSIHLLARGDPTAEPGEEDLARSPVVDALTHAPTFALNPGTPDDPDRETVFEISQQGSLVDHTRPADPEISESRIPNPVQFDTSGGRAVDWYLLTSRIGDIDLATTGASLLTSPTLNVQLQAGRDDPGSQGRVVLGDSGDLDLTAFGSLFAWADEIELRANGSGVVKAQDSNVRFFDPDSDPASPTSPRKLTIVQASAEFKEIGTDGKKTDCSTGCLPDTFQLGGFATNVDYTIESTTGKITLDRFIAEKVWGSDLTLLAHDGDPNTPDVTIAATSNRAFDLILNSLTVGSEESSVDTAFTSGSKLGIATVEGQAYHGKVSVDGRLETSGETIRFHDTVAAAPGATKPELVANTWGRVIFDANVGGGTTPLELLQVNFDPTAILGGTPSVEFGSAAENVAATRIEFVARSLEFLAQGGSEQASPVSRTPVASTLFKRDGDLTFTANDFVMGQGEKLSVAGDVQIDAGNRASIGDISALNIHVTAPTIEIVRRAAGGYLSRNGRLQQDAGVDFVANEIIFDGPIVLGGSGRNPSFAIQDVLVTPGFLDPFTVTSIHADGSALGLHDFEWNVSDALPDLHPEGPSRDDLSSMYFAPDLVPSPQPWLPDRWLVTHEDLLTDLDVATRPTRPSEYAGRLEGASIIDDVGSDRPLRGGGPVEIARERLMGRDAERAVALYQKLFGPDGERAEHVKAVLQDILDDYLRSTGARRVVGFELRRYVKNRPNSKHEAYRTLEDLDKLFAYHRRLGLTPGEYRPIQHEWLRAIQPEGISLDELSEAIHPSRYVRGSDVLDIFGD